MNLMFKSSLESFSTLFKRRWILDRNFSSTEKNHAVSGSGSRSVRIFKYLAKPAFFVFLLSTLCYLYPCKYTGNLKLKHLILTILMLYAAK